MKPPFLAIDAVSSFHAARETVTGADGTFAVDGKPAANWNPFRPLNDPPEIIIFAPGYGSFPSAYGGRRPEWFKAPALAPLHRALYAGELVTVELPRLRTERERRLYADLDLHPNVLPSAVPGYRALVNQQRRQLGLAPY